MSKNKKILMTLEKRGVGQADITSALHVSKRSALATVKAIREHGLTFDAVSSMGDSAINDLFFPKEERKTEWTHLQPDMEAPVERKKENRKLR